MFLCLGLCFRGFFPQRRRKEARPQWLRAGLFGRSTHLGAGERSDRARTGGAVRRPHSYPFWTGAKKVRRSSRYRKMLQNVWLPAKSASVEPGRSPPNPQAPYSSPLLHCHEREVRAPLGANLRHVRAPHAVEAVPASWIPQLLLHISIASFSCVLHCFSPVFRVFFTVAAGTDCRSQAGDFFSFGEGGGLEESGFTVTCSKVGRLSKSRFFAHRR